MPGKQGVDWPGQARPKAKARPYVRGRAFAIASMSVAVGLDVADLAAGVLLPSVDRVVGAGNVALLVVGKVADHGLELLARADLLGDLLRVEGLGGFRGLLDDLERRVAVERVGLGLELLRPEFCDNGLGFRPVARVGWERHQRALDARAADRGELVGGDAVAAHQRGL